MYYCCKGCDECCRDCCHCCEECCGDYCDAIAECFSTPFSFCTFLSAFITFIPFILMIVAVVQSQDYDCVEKIKVQMIIQEGICNLLNFLFCIYLMCQYGRPYEGEPGHQKDGQHEEYNIMQRTINLILYDFVVCFYIFFLIFFVIWTLVGHSWYNSEPDQSPCYKENDGFVMIASAINLWCMWVFLVVGFIVFFYVLMIYSCDDGSCSGDDFSRCLCLIMTCGMCDLGKKKKNKYTKKYAQEQKKKYKPARQGWISSSKRVCGCLALERRGSRQQDQHQNDNINNMNNGVQMANYQQNQQQATYNYPPPAPQKIKKKKSHKNCWGLFSRSSHHSQHDQSNFQTDPVQQQEHHHQPPPPPPQPQPYLAQQVPQHQANYAQQPPAPIHNQQVYYQPQYQYPPQQPYPQQQQYAPQQQYPQQQPMNGWGR